MIKYAKIIDSKKNICEVGIGTNTDFYKSIGMIEMDVEQSFDGIWYIKGYAPKNPKIIAQINELKEKLADTDYKAIKYAEGWYSDEEYAEIKSQRESWRDKIRELEAQIEPEQTGENSTSDGN